MMPGGNLNLQFTESRRQSLAGLVGAMAWGAAMGAHVGRAHIGITTLKMPLMLAGTLALCFPLMHLAVCTMRLPLRAADTLRVARHGLAVFGISLGAFAPVIALFAATAPIPSMASYLNLYLACALCGVLAGVLSVRAMARALRGLAPGAPVRGVLALWALAYQFTGAQAAWLLRPWIGSSYGVEGYWSLSHGLSGNFYVGVWNVLVRWLKEPGVLS